MCLGRMSTRTIAKIQTLIGELWKEVVDRICGTRNEDMTEST